MSKLARAIEAQEQTLKELKNDLEEFEKDMTLRKSKGYVNALIKDIEEVFQRAKKDHAFIVNSTADPLKETYMSEEIFHKIKRNYFNGQLRDEIDKFAQANSVNLDGSRLNSSRSAGSDIRLPRIQIKPFSGKFEEWCEFFNLFGSMIDDNIDLTDIQKLQYLKNSVNGEAARLIQHLPIDSKNYTSAWEILTERYQNKRKLVNTQLRILIEQNKLTHETASSLKSLHDTSIECIHALSNLGIEVETWDCILIYIIFHKLPPQTQRDWEDKLGVSKAVPDWKTFSSFIEGRFNSLENILELNGYSKQQAVSTSYRKTNAFHTKSQPTEKPFRCRLCKASHGVRHCKKFIAMDIKTRTETTKRNSICTNCLGYDHHASSCNSSNRCYKCGLKHHTMLHIDSNTYNSNNNQQAHLSKQNQSNYNTQSHFIQNANQHIPSAIPNSENPNPTLTFNANFNQMQSKVLLATALVKVFTSNGTPHTLRALIDPGSEATFVTENVAQLLNLKRQRISANVTGLGQTSTGTSHYQVNLTVFSRTNSLFSMNISAFVFPHLTSMLPTHQMKDQGWEHLSKLPLADPSYKLPGRIDMLIGADVYASIILEGLVKGQGGSPVAQQTQLGWILTGTTNNNSKSNSIAVQSHFNSLDIQLRRFWEIEEGLEDRKLTSEEEKCQQHFKQTFNRRKDGRYEVRLPFKEGHRPSLGNSRQAAMARFFQIERRLLSNKKLQEAYTDCISEYATLGHMSEVSSNVHLASGEHYFLPHHAVFKETSTTTKLRVVFDASCKTSNGKSLNDHLMVGPRLQADIIDLIAKWRKFKVAFSADISMMYRQIRMAKEDTPYQMILWRATTRAPLKTYALNTVTFGTSSAPYLAVRTLQQLATDVETSHPHVTKALMEGFYVDDLIYGADNEENAITLQRDVLGILKAAGFPLRKWASNSTKVLEQVSVSEREVNLPLQFDSPDAIKTLGIQWHPANDTFKFQINLPATKTFTKRSVLADISRLFDPLGWIAPCILKAKLILQQLWRDELSWDAPIPQEIQKIWIDLRSGLKGLQEIQIPRWIEYEDNAHVQLHGFSDASERAYAAVIYARVIKNGKEHTHILASKTRVAPLKQISLPRLELCGALLLARLLHRISKSMQFENLETVAWSDSMICLAWIKGSPLIRTTFVANRVTEIQNMTDPNIWRHVGTKNNPADVGSRGSSPEDLINNEMWWRGPSFLLGFRLKDHETKVPFETEVETKKERNIGKCRTTLHDDKLISMQTNIAHLVSQCIVINNALFDKFSSLKHLIRCIAVWKRYFNNLKPSGKKMPLDTYPITVDELAASLKQLIRMVQKEIFSEDINALKTKNSVSKGSAALSLNPFLDSDGVLRVGGRLRNSPLPYDQQHPIILKDSHTFSRLLANEVHQRTLHGGQQLMMAEIRSKYWITNLKRLVKSTIHKCVRCHRYNAKMQQQLMGSLPSERVSISRPFTNTGVDYAGPVELKMWKGRCSKFAKGYICVFVCLSTKAIHIELVSDLSAAAFIAAYRRFVARRGHCSNLFSDCGTNFKGANNELRKDSKFISSEWSAEVAGSLAAQNTTWHFNPPSSPHFGGLWEAGVKSIKHHLKRTIGTAKLTFEEYATLLTQIEACLNSRPLCPMTADPNDLAVLTPGHFLIGAPLLTLPDRNHNEKSINNLDRWNYIQRLTQEFWKQWSSTYLHLLQQRPKWLQQQPAINVGDIVLVKEDNLPPSLWILARVQELHPGSDGLTRVVTIKTEHSVLKRPIAKISPLPISNL